ncbi:hypothetical protein MNBD_GAMMA12-198 [hydrothermal vent metagenome]|uniref:Lipoprotein SmpA/OmlA domain-containing protein n=1 Tax=hydrothermal vent metagenome TaxID=652676 RepID=A0A3B0Y1C9_9ZZZZ
MKRLALICMLMFNMSVWSEALTVRSIVETGSQQDSGKRPSRGMTKDDVEKNFGAPIAKKDPVGLNLKRKHHRAITRWVYQNFLVVFDSNHVIATVHRRK